MNNILITSAGRRTQLIKYFQETLNGEGNVVAVDCNNTASALYIADRSYLVPRIDNSNYINKLKEIIKKENIKAVISLLDPELSILTDKKEEFKKLGAEIVISNPETIEICQDKYKMYEFLKENDFKTPKTFKDYKQFKAAYDSGKIELPVFIKPRTGSASIGINKVNDIEELKILLNNNDDLLIQEYIDGQEYGIDVYVDTVSNEIISVFLKKKIRMRAGETDKAVSVKNEKLLETIKEFTKKLKLIGPADMDVFEKDGEFYISEVNPRFGGGYLIAFECGENFPKYIINNINGKKNEIKLNEYEEDMYMIRHDIVTMKSKEELIK
jgi:carbamoyl-phosphate synthase large subunit